MFNDVYQVRTGVSTEKVRKSVLKHVLDQTFKAGHDFLLGATCCVAHAHEFYEGCVKVLICVYKPYSGGYVFDHALYT